MQSVYENYIGEIIRGRRMALGLNAGGIHVLRALCERLGIKLAEKK